jgi:hypothetical protein
MFGRSITLASRLVARSTTVAHRTTSSALPTTTLFRTKTTKSSSSSSSSPSNNDGNAPSVFAPARDDPIHEIVTSSPADEHGRRPQPDDTVKRRVAAETPLEKANRQRHEKSGSLFRPAAQPKHRKPAVKSDVSVDPVLNEDGTVDDEATAAAQEAAEAAAAAATEAAESAAAALKEEDMPRIEAFLAGCRPPLSTHADKFHSWHHLLTVKTTELKHDLSLDVDDRKYFLRNVEHWKHGVWRKGWPTNDAPYYVTTDVPTSAAQREGRVSKPTLQ